MDLATPTKIASDAAEKSLGIVTTATALPNRTASAASVGSSEADSSIDPSRPIASTSAAPAGPWSRLTTRTAKRARCEVSPPKMNPKNKATKSGNPNAKNAAPRSRNRWRRSLMASAITGVISLGDSFP